MNFRRAGRRHDLQPGAARAIVDRVTIALSPTVGVGPFTLAWHGIASAAGILLGVFVVTRLAQRRGMAVDPLLTAVVAAVVAGMVGARLYYLLQTRPASLLTPWTGGLEGFAFYGALIAGIPAAAFVLWRGGHPVLRNLDLIAAAFPAAMAVGRIGDLVNGEHYGAETSLPWGVTYTNPAAHVPRTGVAYQSGALYEIVFSALLAFGVLVVLRRGRHRPGMVLWTVLGVYSLGRFLIFFGVRDVPTVAADLKQAQWTSLALMAVSVTGLILAGRRPPAPGGSRSGGRLARGADPSG